LILTDVACRNSTCLADKARVRLNDGVGLYLEVAPNLSRRWFWRYYFGGKEKRLALGHYTEAGSKKVSVSLKDAREARDDARKLLRKGTDPAQQGQLDKLTRQAVAGITFEAVARELHATKHSGWSPRYAARWIERREKDFFPWIGSLPLQDITAPLLLLHTPRRIENRVAHETAHTLPQTAGQVFRYGIATGRCERNPAPDLHGALKPIVVKHMAAVLDPSGATALMRAIAAYEGQPLTRAALELSALLFQRPGNIRQMEWSEVDFDRALWIILAAKMKRTVHGKVNGRPHLVPLAKRAVAILRELHPLSGHGRYVFPSLLTGERCMSENTLRTALRRMGYTNDEMTPHGFRAMARTILVEQLNVNPDVMVLHTHQASPHLHISVRAEGCEGKRLNPRKEDLHRWRGTSAEKLRDLGIEAGASSQATRGVSRRSLRGWERRPSAAARTGKKRNEHKSGPAFRASRSGALPAWAETTKALAASPDPADRKLSKSIVDFVMQTEVAQAVQRMRAAQRQTELPGMTMDRGRTAQRVSPEPSRGLDMSRYQQRGNWSPRRRTGSGAGRWNSRLPASRSVWALRAASRVRRCRAAPALDPALRASVRVLALESLATYGHLPYIPSGRQP
jgi:integrase